MLERLKLKLYPKSTSRADNHAYPQFCREAARNEEVFRDFKRSPIYNRILEQATEEMGQTALDMIQRDYPGLMDEADKFRENDRYGNPRRYEYEGVGEFSPTTLRYIKYLGDLERLCGSLDGFNIIEIGGGYGGQLKVISERFKFASYTLVDLEPCLELAKKYLSHFDLPPVHYKEATELPKDGQYDLVISNYAFSECKRMFQEHYFRYVLRRSRFGYLAINQITPGSYKSFTRDEYLERIPNSWIEPEIISNIESVYVLVWAPSPELKKTIVPES